MKNKDNFITWAQVKHLYADTIAPGEHNKRLAYDSRMAIWVPCTVDADGNAVIDDNAVVGTEKDVSDMAVPDMMPTSLFDKGKRYIIIENRYEYRVAIKYGEPVTADGDTTLYSVEKIDGKIKVSPVGKYNIIWQEIKP